MKVEKHKAIRSSVWPFPQVLPTWSLFFIYLQIVLKVLGIGSRRLKIGSQRFYFTFRTLINNCNYICSLFSFKIFFKRPVFLILLQKICRYVHSSITEKSTRNLLLSQPVMAFHLLLETSVFHFPFTFWGLQ